MERSQEPGADAQRHIVVIGASAGGVEALVRVVGGLPADLPATVCIVLHLAPGSPSALAAILQRATVLPCRAAVDGEALRAGEILVASPDRHLAVSGGRVSLTVGPRENGHRPAVDVLFRTAAAARDGKVIGVVLSGTRDDGTAGLAVIKSCGGIAIVQDPAEAMYPGMPSSALAHVSVDAVVPSEQVAATIVEVINRELQPVDVAAADPPPADNPGPGSPARAAAPRPSGGAGPGARQTQDAPVPSTCPDCGGVLTEHDEAGFTQWRCRVGHRYSPESLADAQAASVESALWAAVRALDDRASLLLRLATQLERRGGARSADAFRQRAEEAHTQADAVRAALRTATATTLRNLGDGGPLVAGMGPASEAVTGSAVVEADGGEAG